MWISWYGLPHILSMLLHILPWYLSCCTKRASRYDTCYWIWRHLLILSLNNCLYIAQLLGAHTTRLSKIVLLTILFTCTSNMSNACIFAELASIQVIVSVRFLLLLLFWWSCIELSCFQWCLLCMCSFKCALVFIWEFYFLVPIMIILYLC